jgi:predicted RecA/RadA family phage recombinase
MDYTPIGAVAAGDVVVIGRAVAIAREPIAAGELGSVGVEGVYRVPKVAQQAVGKGGWLWWDTSANAATTSAAKDLSMGYAVAAAGASDATVLVKLQYLPAGLQS